MINIDFLNQSPTFSFEVFPPKTKNGEEKLYDEISKLIPYSPSFISVTYGAGGSTRDSTYRIVKNLKKITNIDIVPHLTCVSHKKNDIYEILNSYQKEGISNILALRGDDPKINSSDTTYSELKNEFKHASDLVKYIRELTSKSNANDFKIGVAGFPEGHPMTPNRIKEMDYLKFKIDQGANYIITQLFLSNYDFYDFRDRCHLAGINVPIIAGIMPVTSIKNMKKIASLACGTRFPANLIKSFKRSNEDESLSEKIGVHYATEQCSDLINNQVDGIHFYTLNKSNITRQIYANLGIKNLI